MLARPVFLDQTFVHRIAQAKLAALAAAAEEAAAEAAT